MIVGRKRRKKKKNEDGTLASRDHKPGAGLNTGSDERMADYIRSSLELRKRGYTYEEISVQIQKEYNLPALPHFTTCAKWCRTGYEFIAEEIKVLARQLRLDQFIELERMKSKFLKLACADELEITRWRMEEGVKQPALDENAIAEQLKAGKLCVEIMARQAKLMGMDMEQTSADKDATPDLATLQLWLMGQSNAGEKQITDIKSEVLELKHGVPGLPERNERKQANESDAV